MNMKQSVEKFCDKKSTEWNTREREREREREVRWE